jgi:hypothetical protein
VAHVTRPAAPTCGGVRFTAPERSILSPTGIVTLAGPSDQHSGHDADDHQGQYTHKDFGRDTTLCRPDLQASNSFVSTLFLGLLVPEEIVAVQIEQTRVSSYEAVAVNLRREDARAARLNGFDQLRPELGGLGRLLDREAQILTPAPEPLANAVHHTSLLTV